MYEPLAFPGLAQFVTATAGRNMTRAAHVGIAIGAIMVVLLTIDTTYEAASHWIEGVLWGCLAFFTFEWGVRIHDAASAGRVLSYVLSGRGLVDGACVLAVPVAMILGASARTAWLLAVLWLVKVVPGIPGLRQLRRVLVLESGPLLSVLVFF